MRIVRLLAFLLILFCNLLMARVEPKPGYQYIYPAPNSEYVSTHTSVLVRLEAIDQKTLINVKVISNGETVPGKIELASDEKTYIFKPERPFEAGAEIKVSILPTMIDGSSLAAYTFSFHTAEVEFLDSEVGSDYERSDVMQNSLPETTSRARIMPNGVSVPSDFPHIRVMTNKNTAPGYIFTHIVRSIGSYNIIFENDGSPVWYERWGNGDIRRDFTVQKNGIITMYSTLGEDKYVGYNQNFVKIDEFKPDEGYSNDGHELQVLENGHYLIIGRRDVQVDMSQIIAGGQKNAKVQETTVQEFTPDHQMIFNWPALENLHDGLPYLVFDDPRAKSFCFPHFNAIDVDKDDGQLLVSSRYLNEVTKINRQTGEIIWRLGGEHSDFTFVNDPLNGFSCQHDIRSLGNGEYSIFDNGNYHILEQSRGVVYKLNMDTMTATLVWEYQMPPEIGFSYYMGSFRQLLNGNYLINWAVGELPKATEVTPDGEVVYEMNFVNGYDAYRTFRQPWTGTVAKPRLFVEQDDYSIVLIFNKFGDPNVDYYNIYGGTSPYSMSLIDTSRLTLKTISNLTDKEQYFFHVTSIDKNGEESEFSNDASIIVKYPIPGENLIENGDFSEIMNFWDFDTVDADATAEVTSPGIVQIQINEGGENFDCIQLKQQHISVVYSKTYRFEFDAYSTSNRILEAYVAKKDFPWENYGKINATYLLDRIQHYTYEFTMADVSDYDAQVVFNCGGTSADVFIDNVSLTIIDDGTHSVELPEHWRHSDGSEGFTLYPVFPNPFNSVATIVYNLPARAKVRLIVYNLRGEIVRVLKNAFQNAGEYKCEFDASNICSGIYIYRLKARTLDGIQFNSVHKITVLK